MTDAVVELLQQARAQVERAARCARAESDSRAALACGEAATAVDRALQKRHQRLARGDDDIVEAHG